jgi:hypothetical protein
MNRVRSLITFITGERRSQPRRLSRLGFQVTDSTARMLNDAVVRTAAFPPPIQTFRFDEKDVQRDAKLMSYDIVDKAGKPYVSVNVGGEKKVRASFVKPCPRRFRASSNRGIAVSADSCRYSCASIGCEREQQPRHAAPSLHIFSQVVSVCSHACLMFSCLQTLCVIYYSL